MKIVAISSLGASHRFVLQQLHQIHPITTILQPVGNPPCSVSRSKWQKLSHFIKHPVSTLDGRLHTFCRNRRELRFESSLKSQLFGEAKVENLSIPCHQVFRSEINSPKTQELLASLQPDLVITTGCPLLKPSLFESPKLGTINLHWGLSPFYRGEDTLFWPLYHDDPHQIGITIHEIDRSIDGGPILSQAKPRIDPGDTEITLAIKAAKIAVEELAITIKKIQQTEQISGLRSQSRGRVFLKNSRRWYHDVAYSCLKKVGLRRLPQIPAQTVLKHSDLLEGDNSIPSQQKDSLHASCSRRDMLHHPEIKGSHHSLQQHSTCVSTR